MASWIIEIILFHKITPSRKAGLQEAHGCGPVVQPAPLRKVRRGPGFQPPPETPQLSTRLTLCLLYLQPVSSCPALENTAAPHLPLSIMLPYNYRNNSDNFNNFKQVLKTPQPTIFWNVHIRYWQIVTLPAPKINKDNRDGGRFPSCSLNSHKHQQPSVLKHIFSFVS